MNTRPGLMMRNVHTWELRGWSWHARVVRYFHTGPMYSINVTACLAAEWSEFQ